MEERLGLIKKLEEHWENKFEYFTRKPKDQYQPFGPIQISSLMVLGIAELRDIAFTGDKIRGPAVRKAIFEGIWKMPAMAKWFLTKEWDALAKENLEIVSKVKEDRPVEPGTSPEPSTPRERSSSLPRSIKRSRKGRIQVSTEDGDPKVFKVDKDGNAVRSDKEKNKRKVLDDDRCIVLGTAHPDICHIIPHSFNKTPLKVAWLQENLDSVAPFFNLDDTDLHTLFSHRVGVSDRRWNLVSLEKQLHDWWGRFYFAFKYLGTTEPLAGNDEAIATLKIQFHWMPRKADNNYLTTEERTAQNWTAQFKASYGDPTTTKPSCAITRPANGRIIKTGDLFYVRIAEKKLDKMVHAFAVQWALTKILAMAGGAGVLATERSPKYFDKDGRFVGETGLPAIDLEREIEEINKESLTEEEY